MPLHAVTCKGINCDMVDFYRADGRCLCPICNKPYFDHPFCANSADPSMQDSALFKSYSLNVLCNGDHVHL